MDLLIQTVGSNTLLIDRTLKRYLSLDSWGNFWQKKYLGSLVSYIKSEVAKTTFVSNNVKYYLSYNVLRMFYCLILLTYLMYCVKNCIIKTI